MTSPDPVPPVAPFVAEIVTTDGRFFSATSVAEQTLSVDAAACGFAVERLAATMAPPITPPTNSAATRPTQINQPGRRLRPVGRGASLAVSILHPSSAAVAPYAVRSECRAGRRRVASSQWGESDPPPRTGALLDPGVQEGHHLRDAGRPLLGAAPGRVDPAQVSPSVELGKAVEEGAGPRIGGQRRGAVRGEVRALRALRPYLHRHRVAHADTAVTTPRRTEREP